MQASLAEQIESHSEQIRALGFSLAENLVDAALTERIREQLAPYFAKAPMGRNDFEGFETQRIYSLLRKSRAVAELVEHPLALGLADKFLKTDYLLSAAIAIKVHGGETSQDFHRDDNPAGAPDRGCRDMWGLSTIWMLDDFTDTNGATEVIPGSHKLAMEKPPNGQTAVKVCASAGSVLIFAGNLLHRGGPSSKETPRHGSSRLGITIQYAQPWMRTIENMSLSVPPEEAATFSPRLQALLGYSVAAPGFVGFVDGMHPKRLIDPQYVGRKYRA